MDVGAIATLLKDGGPWALLAVSLFVNRVLWEYAQSKITKIESLNEEWRKDSQAQSDKLASILEKAASERKGGR